MKVQSTLEPKEMSQAVKGIAEVFQGDSDKLPDLMHHTGNLLLKVRSKLSTTQMILAVGALAVGLVLLTKKTNNTEFTM